MNPVQPLHRQPRSMERMSLSPFRLMLLGTVKVFDSQLTRLRNWDKQGRLVPHKAIDVTQPVGGDAPCKYLYWGNWVENVFSWGDDDVFFMDDGVTSHCNAYQI